MSSSSSSKGNEAVGLAMLKYLAEHEKIADSVAVRRLGRRLSI